MNILFRIDASSRVGMGHLRRTLALGKKFKELGHSLAFLIDNEGERLPIAIPYPRIPKIGKKCWDLAIVDSYEISGAEYGKIHRMARSIVAVTDLKSPRFPCDVVINHNLSAHQGQYAARRKAGVKLLLGPKYAMIRDEIVRARRKGFRVKNRVRKILLTLGGGAPPKNALWLLNLLAAAATGVEILFVVPRKTVFALPRHLPGGNRCRLICNPKDMGKIMRQADMALSAAGVTSLELACVGVPAIHVVLADNQWPGAVSANARGIGLNLGRPAHWSALRFASLYLRIQNVSLRRSMSRKARSLVDGRGAGRLAAELARLAGRHTTQRIDTPGEIG